MTRRNKITPPGLCWRDGRPRWVPMPSIRTAFSGRDLKDAHGNWLGLEAAIAAATEINAEVAEWRAMGTPKRRRSSGRQKRDPRTCRALLEAWQVTPEFRALAASTRRDYVNKARLWLADGFADAPVASLSRKHLRGYWRQAYDSRGHAMANGILAVVRAMLTYARNEEWIDGNPAFELGLMSVAPRVAFWSPAKVAAFVATADAMGRPSIADAVVIALHSGQRQADVLAMPPRIFDADAGGGRIRLKQFKRGALIDAPMTPPVAARVAAIRARWKAAGVAAHETIVADDVTGERYASDWFRKLFAQVRAEAARRHPELCADLDMEPGLGALHFQDLRDTAVTRLADAGCSQAEIGAITGHSPETVASMMRHYLATTAAMADNAIAKLTAWLEREEIVL